MMLALLFLFLWLWSRNNIIKMLKLCTSVWKEIKSKRKKRKMSRIILFHKKVARLHASNVFFLLSSMAWKIRVYKSSCDSCHKYLDYYYLRNILWDFNIKLLMRFSWLTRPILEEKYYESTRTYCTWNVLNSFFCTIIIVNESQQK